MDNELYILNSKIKICACFLNLHTTYQSSDSKPLNYALMPMSIIFRHNTFEKL